MNATNRVLNRITLFVVGVVLLAVGAAGVAAMVWPFFADAWTSTGETAQQWLDEQVAATAEGAASTAALVALGALLVVAILLILSLTRLIGRRSRTLVRSADDSALGRVVVTEAFASDALQGAFAGRDDILFASVTAADVRRQPVLHVSISPRQNTSPRRVVDDAKRLVTNLDVLTGEALPTYISLHAGLRTALAHDQRRLS